MIADLFCGAGGWTHAARNLELDVIGYDSDTRAIATYEAAGGKGVLTDLRSYPPERCDGIMASPPCQPYSRAGKGGGRDDTRGTLPMLVAEWAHAAQPQWVAVEQVEGAASMVNRLAAELTRLGYRCALREVSSEQWGVPQVRRRIVLMAHRDRKPDPPVPTHSRFDRNHPRRLQPGMVPWVTMADALGWGPNRPAHTVTAGGTDHGGAEVFGHWTRARWGYTRPATAVVSSFHPEVIAAPGYRNTSHRQDTPDSYTVTVAEAGVLQGFPPDYPWKGSKTAAYRQVGNAFPPPVAQAVLEALL